MADSIREQIVQAVEIRLATITTANGYETNIGNNVDRGIRAPLEEHDLPAIILNEGQEDGDDIIEMNKQRLFLQLTMSARMTFDSNDIWQKIGNKMLADMIKMIGVDDQWGALALMTTIKKNTVGTDEKMANVVGADLTILIHYRIEFLDPYSN